MAKLIYVRLDGARRRVVPVHHQRHAARRHLPLRPVHVRDDGPLGDRPRPGRPVGAHGRSTSPNVWQAAEKDVYSTTLDAVSTAKTRLAHNFNPASVRDMEASATSDLTVRGAHLPAHAFKAGLVDECHLFVRPVLLGEGKPAPPRHSRRAGAAGRSPTHQQCRVPPLPHPDLSVQGHQPRRAVDAEQVFRRLPPRGQRARLGASPAPPAGFQVPPCRHGPARP